MSEQTLRDLLSRLHTAILQERDSAKALDLERMQVATQEKEQLLNAIGPVKNINTQDRVFIEQIQHENRRNAYLFLSTLNWIRESMQFFGKQVAPVAYSHAGYAVKAQGGGRLLSGKV